MTSFDGIMIVSKEDMDSRDLCICRGTGSGLMVCCSICNNWYHCSCVDIDEEKAKNMTDYICDSCTFEDPNEVDDPEDEYIYEKEDSPKKKRSYSESKRSFNYSNMIDSAGCPVEEMSEKSVQRAICSIEQKLLLEDDSPSIHSSVNEKSLATNKVVVLDDFTAVLSSYPELKALRNDITKKGLINHLVRLKEYLATSGGINEMDKRRIIDKMDDDMEYCVSMLSQYDPPTFSIPINADIRTFDWGRLGKKQYELTGRYYDVIMMDPPWQLATANPTRGVAIAYEQLDDNIITSLPLDYIQKDGYLFLWVINAKYRVALEMLENWGYKFVDEIAWVKCNRSHRMAKSHGFYLQHSKETCFVAMRGSPPPLTNFGSESDVIYSERLGQSQKPIDIYEMIERLVPNGYYLEVFGRRNNMRNNWVTVGNEL